MLTISLVDPANRVFETSAHQGGANVGPAWDFPDQDVVKKFKTADFGKRGFERWILCGRKRRHERQGTMQVVLRIFQQERTSRGPKGADTVVQHRRRKGNPQEKFISEDSPVWKEV